MLLVGFYFGADEMIGKYKWGVEYPTNGERPDLPDDVKVRCFSQGNVWYEEDFMPEWNWGWIRSFKITDPRYKPADTSYLDCKSDERAVSVKSIRNWPPVAGMTVELWHGGRYIEDVEFLCERGGNVIFWRYSNDSVDSAVMPTAELRPIRTHREKVIEAAIAVCNKVPEGESVLDYLYNAGMLALPVANCNTKG